ncbi:MAG: DUF1996 domain-containing protein [Pseudomonadota bacterium]
MINLIFRPQALLITIPLLSLIVSNHTNAEIYKWRDNRGVMQYSDRAPLTGFGKVTPNELVNSLQTKDLCTIGPIKKSIVSRASPVRNIGGLFASFKTTSSSSVTGTTIGSKNVTVLGFSTKKPIKTITSTTTTTSTTTAPTTTTSTTTSPTTTTAPTAEPVIVATTDPLITTPTTPTTNNIIQTLLMPAVDISKNMLPAVGHSALRIEPTSYQPGTGGAAFRINCKPSHMGNDDPIIYPNQQGAAHHHTFFGNTSLDYKSNLMALSTTGTSTCKGGTANNSAYWIPSIIDTSDNSPLVPDDSIFYYKTTPGLTVLNTPPKGLRMIAGNSRATNQSEAGRGRFACGPGPNSTRTTGDKWHYTIPTGEYCEVGDKIQFTLTFPQCWDGKNLDSPNHQDHMKYENYYTGCPVTHPVAIPQITLNVFYTVKKATRTTTWRLASDNYAPTLGTAGYSAHGDWVNGWDEEILTGIVKNCLNKGLDGHASLLCDGRRIF